MAEAAWALVGGRRQRGNAASVNRAGPPSTDGRPQREHTRACRAASKAALSSKKPASKASANGALSSVAPGTRPAGLRIACGSVSLARTHPLGQSISRSVSNALKASLFLLTRVLDVDKRLELGRQPHVDAQAVVPHNLLSLSKQPGRMVGEGARDRENGGRVGSKARRSMTSWPVGKGWQEQWCIQQRCHPAAASKQLMQLTGASCRAGSRRSPP